MLLRVYFRVKSGSRAAGDQAISLKGWLVCVCKQLQKKEGVWSGLEGGRVVWLLALDAGRFSLHLTAARRHSNQELRAATHPRKAPG